VTSNSQAIDVKRNYDKLIRLFERMDFFLLLLESYTKIPLTSGFKELLGRILAQIILILSLLTKVMRKRWRTSELNLLPRHVWTDYGSGIHLQRLMGGRDVEEALLWLDMLTNVENLVTLGRSVDVKHCHDVNCKVKATKHSTQCFMSTVIHIF